MAKAIAKPRSKGKKPEVSSEELKAQIIRVARKHFAINGFLGASVKDIAREADVANSLINYHFGDKEGLFHACVEVFARGRMEAIIRILGEPRSQEDLRVRIELFVEEMQSAVTADPHGFDIVDREVRSGNPVILKVFGETMLVAFKAVVEFFRQAQQNGVIRSDLDPMIVASLLFTSTCDSARKEVIANKFFNLSFSDPEWRRTYARHVSELFLRGVVV